MFQKLLILICFIFLAALLTPSSPVAHAQRENLSEAPYIYYYSSYHEAFVIERADGTDTRLLGQGLHPERSAVSGAGWSPSGEWFGWISYNQQAPFSDNYEAWVMRSDGSSRLHSTDGFEAYYMAWSPVDDLLMLADSQHIQGEFYHLYLIDPSTDRIIASYEPPESIYRMSSPVWHPDGQGVIFYEIYEGEQGKRSYTLTLEGDLIEYGDIGIREYDDHTFTGDGRLISLVGNQLRLLAIDREQNSFIPLPSSDIMLAALSPDRNSAVLLSCIDCRVGRGALWLLNFTTLELTLIDEYALSPVSWSPVDNHLVLYRQLPNQMTLFNVSDGTSQPLRSLPDNRQFIWPGWQWMIDGRLMANLAISMDYPCPILMYDPNEKFVWADISHNCWSEVLFSPDQRFEISIFFRSSLHDRQTGTQIILSPHSAKNVMGGTGGRTYWHPASEWAIVVENNCVAGGCGFTNVLWRMVNASGVYRDINLCEGTQCLNWLPEQVNLEQLPPALEQVRGCLTPVQVIQTDDWVTQLSWSPDSQFLASGKGMIARYHWGHWLDVWRVDTGAHIQNFGDDGLGANLTWEQDTSDVYEAILTEEDSPPDTFPWVVSPNQRYFIAEYYVDQASEFRVHDFSSEALRYTLRNYPEYAYQPCFAFSSDERWLAGGSHSAGRLQFWEAETGEHIMDFDLFACGVAFSPDGLWLAVGVGWDIHIYAMAEVEAALLSEK